MPKDLADRTETVGLRWIVLPAECEAAVKAWNPVVEQRGESVALALVEELGVQPDHWLEWIAFLEGAATHDGFEGW